MAVQHCEQSSSMKVGPVRVLKGPWTLNNIFNFYMTEILKSRAFMQVSDSCDSFMGVGDGG